MSRVLVKDSAVLREGSAQVAEFILAELGLEVEEGIPVAVCAAMRMAQALPSVELQVLDECVDILDTPLADLLDSAA